jgi:amidase
VPLLLSDWQTFNEIYGTTNNPWDPTKTPGGSSGGSAVALATGMAALELGSDIGASIRNPAHYCGVTGHKPTHNLVPTRGQSVSGTLSIPDISVAGPMARTAEDLALGLSVTAGADEVEAPGLVYDLPPPRHRTLKGLRVAVMVSDPSSAVDSEYQQKITRLGEELAKLGATVSHEARPAIDTVEAWRNYVMLLRSFTFWRAGDEEIARWKERAKAYAADDFSYKAMVSRAASLTYRDYLSLNEQRHQMRWRWHEFFKDWDVLLCPVAAGPAWPHDHKGERVDRNIEVNGKPENVCHQLFWAGFSGVAFLPSTVVPIERHSNGLPLGVQIVGPHLEDRTTIEVGRLIEQHFGGYQPPPGYA